MIRALGSPACETCSLEVPVDDAFKKLCEESDRKAFWARLAACAFETCGEVDPTPIDIACVICRH